MPDIEKLGTVYNNAHPATPLVLGDFEVMKSWEGDEDGGDVDVLDVGGGTIVTADLDLAQPTIFRRGDEVWFIAKDYGGSELTEEYTNEEIRAQIEAIVDEVDFRLVIDIPSGVLVIGLSYFATPEEGADTSHLTNPICYAEGSFPKLPVQPPDDVWIGGETLIAAPVVASPHEVVASVTDDGFMRMVVRPVERAELDAFTTLRAAMLAEEAEHSKAAAPAIGPLDLGVIEAAPERITSLEVQVEWAGLAAQRETGVHVRWCALPMAVQDLARTRLSGDASAGATNPSAGSIPDFLATLTNLRSLTVADYTRFADIAIEGDLSAITSLPLEELDLGATRFVEIPTLPASLTRLKLPPTAGRFATKPSLANLTRLSVPVELFDQLGDLPRLETLELLPPVTSDPWGRTQFALHRCEVPAAVAELKSLRSLSLSRLGVENIPESVATLPALESIDIWGCRMTDVIDLVRRGTGLRLTGNPLSAYQERAIKKLSKLEGDERLEAPLPKPKKRPKKQAALMRRLSISSWDALHSLVLSKDGSTIAAGEYGGFSSCAWDVASGELLWEHTLDPAKDVDARTTVRFDEQGRVVAVPSTYHLRLAVLEARAGTLEHQFVSTDPRRRGGFESIWLGRLGDAEVVFTNGMSNDQQKMSGVLAREDLAGRLGFGGFILDQSADGRWLAVRAGDVIEIYDQHVDKLDDLAVAYEVPDVEYGPARLLPDGEHLLVVSSNDEMNPIATIHRITDGTKVRSFSLAPDCEDMPRKRRPGKSWPAISPSGAWIAFMRESGQAKVDGTVGVLEVATGEQRAVLPNHAPPYGRLNRAWGAMSLSSRRPHQRSPMLWLDENTLAVGELVRDDDESHLGSGATIHQIP